MNAPQLQLWAYGPFEVLMHAETHFRSGEDLDRRIAMIGFDNAIEVAITTYLSLNPIQRANRSYPTASVETWLRNFHSKADFFFIECQTRSVMVRTRKDELVWFHDVRNGQYHQGEAAVPQRRELEGVRAAALEVFSVLFDLPDVEAALAQHLAAAAPTAPTPRSDEHDRLIDNAYPMVDVCGQPEYVSDVLYALDSERYREVALELREGRSPASAGDGTKGDAE